MFADIDPLSDIRFAALVRCTDEPEAWKRAVLERLMSAAAFGVLQLEFISGGPYDDPLDARQAVINETLARLLWPGEDAVGRTMVANDETYTVTGVVRDSYLTGVTAVDPVFHRAPTFNRLPRLVFRTDLPGAAGELRALVRRVDPRLDVTVRPVAANIDRSIRDRRFVARLAWTIGALGLGLATIGVFGVFAYAVEERRHEMGVRLALGAQARNVVRVMFAMNRWSIGGGLAVGFLLSACGGFVLRSYLFGLSPFDPIAYLSAALLLAAAAAVGTAVPAWRAVRVDRALTLRSD